ncbi:MAG: hypothetical protein ACXAB7_23165 [Candidatus Kariarchaeaceae archaeon]|jgi:hypothetical protein
MEPWLMYYQTRVNYHLHLGEEPEIAIAYAENDMEALITTLAKENKNYENIS